MSNIFRKNHKYRPVPALVLLLPLLFFCTGVTASDSDANAKIAKAIELEKAKDFYAAAKKYADAEFEADSPVIKANSLKKMADNYRKCGLIYQEFLALDKLLSRHSAECDSVAVVNRIFDIGDEFYSGKREPSFWSLRFIPWLKEPDRTVDVYGKALEHAPFSVRAANAILRMSLRLLDENKGDEAIKYLQKLQKDYPDSPEHRFSYLMLGEIYFNLSQKGDGDGRFNQEALAQFREFRAKYPGAPELAWVHKMELKSKDIQAQRLYSMAQYYKRLGRNDASARYLAEVLQKYPDSVTAVKSEKMLVDIDRSYLPQSALPAVEQREQSYNVHNIPDEPDKLILIPEESNGKYLLPIYDLKYGSVRVEKE